MMKALNVLILALVASCGNSANHERAQKLAQRANPIIDKLRAPVSIVLDANSDAKAVRNACLEAINDAAALSSAGFKDSAAGTGKRTDTTVTLGVDDVMYIFSMQKQLMCREDQGDGSRDATCRKWCVEMFTDLADAVARAKESAAKEDVTLQALR